MQDKINDIITLDKLEDMKAQAQLMQEELYFDCMKEYGSTGKLTSAKLNEKSNEYENYVLTIHRLEELLADKYAK
ncbi:MAG: hypothetical protein RR232_00525 [Clostridia bacterium]